MATLNVRADTFLTTTGTTWATTASAVDGTYGASTNTYAVWTSIVSGASATIEVGWGSQFAAIPADATNITLSVIVRHRVSNITNVATVAGQCYDGGTAVGPALTLTKNTTVHNDTTVAFSVTRAQLQSATFKVRLTATRAANTSAGTFSLDSVDAAVFYTQKLETFTDDFPGATLDTTKWPTVWDATSNTLVSGQVALPITAGYSAIGTALGYSFVDTSVLAKPTPVIANGKQMYMQVRCVDATEANVIEFLVNGVAPGVLTRRIKTASAVTFTEPSTYDLVADAWWKITSSGTTITWFTSPDGATWTQKSQTTTTINLTKVCFYLYAGGTVGGTAYADNVNVPGVAATGGRPKVWTGSAWVAKPAKVWTGSAWVEKPVKRWNGSSWVPV